MTQPHTLGLAEPPVLTQAYTVLQWVSVSLSASATAQSTQGVSADICRALPAT